MVRLCGSAMAWHGHEPRRWLPRATVASEEGDQSIHGFAGRYMVLIVLWLRSWSMYCFELEDRKMESKKGIGLIL